MILSNISKKIRKKSLENFKTCFLFAGVTEKPRLFQSNLIQRRPGPMIFSQVINYAIRNPGVNV